jgi:hypothetical protein
VPITGQLTNVIRRLAANSATRSTSAPTMLVWSQTAPSGTGSAACPITARTAEPSMSIVITNAASHRVGGRLGQVRPSAASTRALSAVRFHTRTWKPAFSKLRAIGAPMIPVPRNAIRSAR